MSDILSTLWLYIYTHECYKNINMWKLVHSERSKERERDWEWTMAAMGMGQSFIRRWCEPAVDGTAAAVAIDVGDGKKWKEI